MGGVHLTSTKSWDGSSAPQELGRIAYAYNSLTLEVEAGSSDIQGHP